MVTIGETMLFVRWKVCFYELDLRYWKVPGWANNVTFSKQIALILSVLSWSHIMVYFKSCISES